MAIGITYKSSLYSTSGTSPYTASPTWTPAANSYLIAFVVTTGAATWTTDPSGVTGHGQTYTKLTLGTSTAGTTHKLSAWVAKAGATPTATACVVTVGGSPTGTAVIEFEVTGADLSGTDLQAIVASDATNTGASGTSATVTLAAPGNTANRAMTFLVQLSNNAPAAAGAWTLTVGAAGNYNTPATGAAAMFNAALFDVNGAGTVANGATWRMVGVEIKSAIPDPTPARGSLTLSGLVPSVALALGVGAGALALAGPAPTVTETAPGPIISVPAGSLVFKGPARPQPGSTFTPDRAVVAFTGLAPSVGIDYVISPAAGALSVAGQAPAAREAHLAQPAAGSLSLVGQSPSGDRTYLATPSAGTLVLAGQAPQTLLAYTTSPDVGALTLTGQTPAVTQTLNALPDVGALSLTGLAPAVLEAHLAQPAAGSLTLLGWEPSTGGTVTVAPDVGTLAVEGQIPTLALTFVVTPAVGPLAVGGFAPDLQRTYLVSPAAGTLTLAGDAPAVQQTLLASPAAGTLALTGLAPSAIQAHLAQPATGTLSLTGYAPSGSSNYHSILVGTGTGYTDVSPKQVVRTSAGVVYLVATNCDSYPCTAATQTVRVYKGDSAPLATTFTRKDAAHEPTDTGTVAVALDGADVLHIVWQNRNGASATRIRYATFDPATDLWGTAEDVDGNVGAAEDVGQGDQFCAVAVDADGIPHVAYLSHDGTHRRLTYRHRTGGTWSAPTLIDDASFGTNEKCWHPNLAFDSHGRIVFAWAIGDFNGNSTGRILVRVLETDGTTLGTTQVLDAGTAKVGIDQSTTLLCAHGLIHTAWILGGSAGDDSDEYIRYAYATEALTPSFATNHPTTWDSHNPSLGLGDTPSTIRIYAHGGANPNDDNLYYTQGTGGAGAWGTRTLYATGTFDASVSTRWAQFFHWEPGYLDLAYWDQDYANDLYYGTELAYASRQPTTGGLTLAGLAPTLTVSVSATATPAAGELTLTGLAPTARQTYLISPAAGSLTLSGLSPSTTGTVTISPAAGALSLTGLAPTLQRTYLASPATGALSLDGQTPQTFATILAQPGAGTLTLAGQAPTLGRTYLATPAAASLSLTGQAPSLGAGVGTPAGALALTGQAPTATATDHALIAVGVGTLTLTGSAPTLARTFTIAPPAGALSVTGLAPTLSVNVAVPVPAGALAFSGTTPAFDYGIGVPAGTLVLTGATPELAMGLLEVPAGALTFTGYAPNAYIGLNICETTVESLNPIRTVASLIPERTVESLNPSRTTEKWCLR